MGGNGFFILTDLISSELSGCDASQFAVAATNENRPIGLDVSAVSRGSSLDSLWAARPTAF